MMNKIDGFQQHDVRRSNKRLQHKHRNNNLLLQLPEGVLTDEILIRLPAKQLARMRCVSKLFCGYLSQPRFIKSHLDRNLVRNNNKDNEILLVVNPGISDLTKIAEVTAQPSRSPNIQLNDLIKLPPDFPISKSVMVRGSVHGLICFQCGDDDHPCFGVYIWNPSLSALMRLPNFTCPSTPHEDLMIDIKFGFDPKSDDYKVVKLMNHCEPGMQVEVYSMRKGTWGFISESFPSKFDWDYSRPQAIVGGHDDGHVYWLCPTDHDYNAIVAFDLGNETFYAISLPHSICRSKGGMILCFFDRKLCVIKCRHGQFEMWVMNERGVTESWVKHTVLSRFTSKIRPMGFTVNNEFLFRYGCNNEPLALYDPDTTKVKYFEGCPYHWMTNVVQYVDSLVWITAAKKHDNSSCVASGRLRVRS